MDRLAAQAHYYTSLTRIPYAHILCASMTEGVGMTLIFDPQAPKKATNLSVNADLLARARECDINLSATLERALLEALRQKQRAAWVRDNREAIDAYNAQVEEHGVFSDGTRTF